MRISLSLLLSVVILSGCGGGPADVPQRGVTDGEAPTIEGVSLDHYSSVGAVAGTPILDLSLIFAQDVARAVYTLDLVPLNSSGPEDLSVEASSAPDFGAQLDLTGLVNQNAQLIVDYFNADDDRVSTTVAPLWIFNQQGDVNGDGATGLADIDSLKPLLGLGLQDPGFVGFADLDRDGRITEADAGGIGYSYGTGCDSPQISAIEPLNVTQGLPVTMSATVSGTSPLTYEWTFNHGAALPASSNEPSPLITPGIEGNYDCLLTVTNECGSDTFPFVLIVAQREQPVAALEASPRTGASPLLVNFDASGSSTPAGTSIIKYEWDWDSGGDFDDETTGPSNSHTFIAEEAHNVRMRITNSLGDTSVATQQILVTNQQSFGVWQQYSIAAFGSLPQFDDLWAASVAGRPAAIWYNDDTDQVFAAWADSSQPASSGEWEVEMLVENRIGGSKGVSIADIGGTPAAACVSPTSEVLYARWSPTGWTTHVVTPLSNGGFYYGPVLASVGGKPALIFAGKREAGGDTRFFYAYATVAEPASSADWQFQECAVDHDNYEVNTFRDYPPALIGIGGMPQIAFMMSQSGNKRRWLARATTPTPASPADWIAYDAYFNSGYVDMEVMDGLPVFIDGNRAYHQTAAANHTSYSDWSFYFPDQEYSGPEQTQLEIIDGLPTIAWFQNPVGIRVGQATMLNPGEADWFTESIEPQISGDRPLRLSQAGGLPVLFLFNEGNLDYCYPLP